MWDLTYGDFICFDINAVVQTLEENLDFFFLNVVNSEVSLWVTGPRLSSRHREPLNPTHVIHEQMKLAFYISMTSLL